MQVVQRPAAVAEPGQDLGEPLLPVAVAAAGTGRVLDGCRRASTVGDGADLGAVALVLGEPVLDGDQLGGAGRAGDGLAVERLPPGE